MELSEEDVMMCKSEDFFDFVCPKTGLLISSQNSASSTDNSCDTSDALILSSSGSAPFIDDPNLIDSSPYGEVGTDPNNNVSHQDHTPMKSFLDEILLQDPLNHNSSSDSSIGDEDGPQNNNGTLELLGTFTWVNSDDPSLLPISLNHTPSLLDHNNQNWDPGARIGVDGMSEVTTLTNLLDPLFVSFEESSNKMDNYFTIGSSSGGDGGHCTVISSDLITSTFLNESSNLNSNRNNNISEESDILTVWQAQKSDSSQIMSQESLLRTALQSSKGKGDPEMTELRKVLSFPPLRGGDGTIHNEDYPSSSSQHQQLQQQHLIISSEGDSPYYELKVLDSVFVDPDALIPNNVEELVLSRLHPIQQQQQQQLDLDERKVNSTTSGATLTTKWTYIPQHSTTTNNNSPSSNSKTTRRRCKKNQKITKENDMGEGGMDKQNNNCNKADMRGCDDEGDEGGSGCGRKERSLHYCTICSKGFKDKYSVNVHVRTHTGEKPFSCTLCGKNFRQKAHLAKHYQTHAAKAAQQGNSHVKGSNKNRNTQPATTTSSS